MVWNILGITPQNGPRREYLCFLGLGSCGSHQSTSISDTITNDINLSASVSTALKTSATTTINAGSINTASFDYGNQAKCCPGCTGEVMETYIKVLAENPMTCDNISVTTSGQSTITAYSKMDVKTFANMKSNLKSQLAAMVHDAVQQASQEDINTISNILSTNNKKTDIETNINNSISEAIDQSFTSDTVNSILVNTLSENSSTMSICYPVKAKNCVVDASSVQNIQTKNILHSLATIVQSASAISKLSEAITSETSQTDKGIVGGIADIFKQLGPIIIAVAVIMALLVIVVIVLVIFKSTRKHGSTPATSATVATKPSTTTTTASISE